MTLPRIAAFGFRNYPPCEGSAGADKFAMELLPRLVQRGFHVTAYNRVYPGMDAERADNKTIDGVEVRYLRTVNTKGFDTLLHSTLVVYDIIKHNRADIVHIQNGGNSIFGAVLRLFGKRTYLSQDGIDWTRDKWPWYAKAFLWLSAFLTARVHNRVIFDNIFAREEFEARFRRSYDFIPFGADVNYDPAAEDVLERFGLIKGNYFLFVGRFIPDKGLHWLVPAFERLTTTKKLVLVGGSPNPSSYEANIRSTKDERIIFSGFIYGAQVHALMRNAYAYVQPSAIEGLSPVILEAAFLGAPIICSDIPQNKYGMAEHATYFANGSVDDLNAKLQWAINEPQALQIKGEMGAAYVARRFSWNSVVDEHVALFVGDKSLAADVNQPHGGEQTDLRPAADAPTIAIIDPLGKHGGHHYYVDGTARGLSDSGYRVHVYVTAFTGVTPGRPFEMRVAFGALYGSDPAALRVLRYIAGLTKAVWWSWRSGAKVVNLHAFHHDLREVAAIWGCRLAGARVILTIHDVESFGSTRSSWIRRLSLAGASALVFQNAFSKHTFEQMNGSAKASLIVPHGHYVDAYPEPPSREEARRRLGIDDDAFVMLFFGNTRQEKGLDLLIQALAPLAGISGWILVVAGKMRPSQEQSLRDLIASAGITDNIRIDAGHVSDEHVPNYYRASNLVVIPYRHIFESGVTIMSMSMGRAALVSDLEPLTEKIVAGETGLVFANGNVAALTEALKEALARRSELDVFGENGHHKVLTSRSWMHVGALLGEFARKVSQM